MAIIIKKIKYQTKLVFCSIFYPFFQKGSSYWLIAKELKYGGLIKNVKRRKISVLDPRTSYQISTGGMQGGDRMLYHGYAEKYAQYLAKFFRKNKRLNIAEIGILKGTGLAIWCDLFKNSAVYGFDIDLSHFQENVSFLKRRGAFTDNCPAIFEFDQFLDNKIYLKSIFGDNKIDICIDDGFHSDEAILSTLNSVAPYLSADFVYFIEDNSTVSKIIASEYPKWKTESSGQLTIIIPK